MGIETQSPGVLVLSDAVRERLERSARSAYPREACGLLIGRRDGRRTEVLRAEEACNLCEDRSDRFELDPADQVRVDQRARAEGLDVVGVWHSHPDHPARPSSFDLERAWEGWSYVIVSVAESGTRELRSWRLVAGAFREEEVKP